MKTSLHHARRRRHHGYILFEMVMAITIFSIAVLGLVKALKQAGETANLLRRDQIIRVGLRNVFEELRNKPLAKMSTTVMDTTYGISYTSTTEALSLKTTSGSILSDMYKLTIRATSSFDGVPQEDTLDVYVYKPAQP
jgi:Tfp pilus assembly protein PilV